MDNRKTVTQSHYSKLLTMVIPEAGTKPAEPKPPRTYQTVPDSNYFKYGQSLAPKLFFDESDSEIISMLEELFLIKQA